MTREHMADMVALQGRYCAELGSPLYGALLARAAEDVRTGGPCARALAGHEADSGPQGLALRLAGAVHALVLSGRAPELARYYPSAGGRFDPVEAEPAWRAFRAAVSNRPDEVRTWLSRSPQTNEVGRAHLLVAGLLWASDRAPLPIRLLELGASAGLMLRADRFRCTAEGLDWGPRDAEVQLAGTWRGTPPAWLTGAARRHPALDVVERRGCDLAPVDPRSEDGVLALRSYVWPDQTARHERLAGALRLAAREPAEVVALGAGDFLDGVGLREGTLTVVWHSVMRQYVPKPEWTRVRAALDRLAEAADERSAVLHLAFEPVRVGTGHPFRLLARLNDGPTTTLAEAHPHGLPALPAGEVTGRAA
ncbi:DUF2332 domain-containing protein [Streptomyces sp. JJ38]|uniref:DUF2332 domain-containing protein n=1 Tax=Streptomyces sp. JJ38 TaxID=2738128 RepID=UPI001C5820AD|nr:DUF2332 domain-containing protein [Streptomyces sp. JJ38]MBW1595994.1 DUF2332 domain-containing protein [Streptomyces sp. JJ38]